MDYGHEQTDKNLKKLERRLAHEYDTARKSVEQKLKKHLEQYDALDKQYAKMVEDGKMKKKTYTRWRQSAMMRTKGWEDLRDTLASDLSHTNEIATGMINQHTIDCYALNMNYGTYEIENGYHIGTSFSMYDHRTVENLMQDDPQIIPQAKMDIPEDLRWNRRKLTSAITQGILTGDSIPDIAKRLGSVADMNEHAAIRNARTYTTAAENKGRTDSYVRAQNMGIELEQEWLATLDQRTRSSHRHLDGERVKIGAKFSNGCRYPGDPEGRPEEIYNCRCTLVAALKGYDYHDDRFSRLPGDMSYEDWKNAHTKGGDIIEPPRSFADRINDILDKAHQSSEGVTTDVVRRAGREFASDVKKEYLDKLEQLKEQERLAMVEHTKLESQLTDIRKKMKDLSWAYENASTLTEGELEALGFKTAGGLRKHFQELEERAQKFKSSPEYAKVFNAYKAARNAYNDANSVEKIGEYMKRKIGEVREVGVNGLDVKAHLSNSRSPMRPIVESAYDHYPTAWLRRSIAEGKMTVKKTDRGYYWHGGGEIAVSGYGKASQYETAIHELGHRFERVVPGMLDMEKEFYESRTSGEPLEWLGSGYAKSEVTRKDRFLDPYMGKDYGGDAYELVSMGFEYAYTNPLKLSRDPDMQELIYGALLVW